MQELSASEAALLERPRETDISVEMKQQLVDRILHSPAFIRAERLSSFLLHVCEMERKGRVDEISEQAIGEVVFGRSKNYDSSIDGIVRSHASRLRLRLNQYFEQEGLHETIRLDIPRGAYVPVFKFRLEENIPGQLVMERVSHTSLEAPALVPPVNMVSTPENAPVAIHRGWFRSPIRMVTAILCSILAVGFLLWVSHFAAVPLFPPSPSDALWRTMFRAGSPTLLVAGDAGANMFENMARRQITADEYGSRSWTKDPLAQTPPGYSWNPIATRTYTTSLIVPFAIRLARLPQVADGQLKGAFARDLQLENLKEGQIILVGGPNYNPWEQLLERDENFRMIYDGVENSISITNRQPIHGEPAVFKWRQTDTKSHTGYSLIKLSQSLNGSGRILTLEGTTAQGDAAASEFLLDRAKMDSALHDAIAPNGRINNFEMVLETDFVAGGTVDSKVRGLRIHPTP
jgi:hypothetical protein